MRFQGAKLDYARGSGNSVIAGQLIFVDGDFAGQAIPHQYSLQEENAAAGVKNALWRIKDDLRVTSRLTPDMIQEGVAFDMTDEQTRDLLNGMEGYAEIFTDQFNNQPRSKLRKFITADEYQKRQAAMGNMAPKPTVQANAAPAVNAPAVSSAPTQPANGAVSVNMAKKPF